MAEVILSGVGKRYPDGTHAVRAVDLDVRDGEFLVLVGPSGCGKTTALRMIAGLEEISDGRLRVGERVVNGVPARDRDVAMVFQSYALYPHLSVRDNIGFGLSLRKVAKRDIRDRVDEAARILGLEEHLDRKPRDLSGGQRQRVAMGRAIVRKPQAFLMDEPLSNLDAKLRVQMRTEIARLQRDLGVTTVYVTHDQTEAMTLGDRVAVLKQGELQQVAAPQELYDHPRNLFVAGFIGSPAMNLLRGTLTGPGDGPGGKQDDGAAGLDVGSQRLTLQDRTLAELPELGGYLDRDVVVGIRPEDLEDAELAGHRAGATLASEADLVEAMGSDVLVHFGLDASLVVTDDTKELARDAGADQLGTPGDRESALVARFSPRSGVAEGHPITVVVDTERMHFFDPDTGRAIGEREKVTPAPEAR